MSRKQTLTVKCVWGGSFLSQTFVPVAKGMTTGQGDQQERDRRKRDRPIEPTENRPNSGEKEVVLILGLSFLRLFPSVLLPFYLFPVHPS
jgi:hypothetical protein